MGHRLSKIYTKTGDEGLTGLGDGSRVKKNHARVEAYGTVDELNSQLGVVRSLNDHDLMDQWLSHIQHDLFDLGGELSVPGMNVLTSQYVESLERQIDEMNSELAPLKEFILPAGDGLVSVCHVARCVCRRAERRLFDLLEVDDSVSQSCLQYLNRLSDWLFVAARHMAKLNNVQEVYWKQRARTSSDEA